MPAKKEEFKRGKIVGVCWFAGILLAFHLIGIVLPGIFIRDFWDPQYAFKQGCLRACLKENPGRPLWLVMGSSRVEDGFDAGMLNGGDHPLVFNFGMGGADLFRQYICLRRLLADGIKPARVGIEIVGATMSIDESIFVTDPTFAGRARWGELGIYSSYSREPATFHVNWIRSRFDPTFLYSGIEHRHFVREAYSEIMHLRKYPYDQWGWLAGPSAPLSESDRRILFGMEKDRYQPHLTADFKVSANVDRALRQILDLCKKEKIDAFLFGMPESPKFQALYPPVANAAIATYLAGIRSEYRLVMIDGRSWIDEEDAADGQHLVAKGAEKFTRRFGGELFKMPDSNAAPH